MTRLARLTLYGISVSTTCSLPFLSSSVWATPRVRTMPRPVVRYWRMPSRPLITPPVGKSGPRTILARSSAVVDGLSITRQVASTSSPRLWGGMLVVMPTAMPVEPFIRRCGRPLGRTVGSVVDSL